MKDLEKYMEEDAGFAVEVIHSFQTNLTELRDSLTEAIKLDDPKPFFEAYHKVKVTLSVINNKRLEQQASNCHELVKNNPPSHLDVRQLNAFRRECTNSITQLSEKLKTYQN